MSEGFVSCAFLQKKNYEKKRQQFKNVKFEICGLDWFEEKKKKDKETVKLEGRKEEGKKESR